MEQGVAHVAMESTGVYWKPVINVHELGGFSIMVMNARHIKYVPGHKTDKKDSGYIQQPQMTSVTCFPLFCLKTDY